MFKEHRVAKKSQKNSKHVADLVNSSTLMSIALLAQILAQRTTNASVGHFNQLFFGARQVGTATFYQLCVDIDL